MPFPLLRIGVALVAVALLWSACGSGQPAPVSLATLTSDQEAYRGREVTTQGVVRRFSDPGGPYYVIEDAQHDRVEVRPASTVAGYEGRRIDVTGRFDVSDSLGRVIEVERVSVPSP